MDPERVKHLELIQAVITRMNTNSFQIKGWCITIVSALLAIYASNKNESFILISASATLLFWFLDGYYLMQERKFRGLYNDVAEISTPSEQIKLFEMRTDLYTKGRFRYLISFSSKTIITFYLSIIFILGLLFCLIKFNN